MEKVLSVVNANLAVWHTVRRKTRHTKYTHERERQEKTKKSFEFYHSYQQ